MVRARVKYFEKQSVINARDINNIMEQASKNAIELEDEESILLAKLAETRKKKEAELNKLNRIVISNIEVMQDTVFFKNTFDQGFKDFLYRWPGHNFNGQRNSIPAETWMAFESEVRSKFPTVFFKYSNEELQSVKNWKPAPKFTIERDEKGFKITAGPKGQVWKIRDMPAIEPRVTQTGTYFLLPFTEAWRLYTILEEFGEDVKWAEGCKEICLNQLEQRAKLDIIAKGESSDLVIDLNGHELKMFQRIGVDFIIQTDFNCIVGDEMGLGKTPQALAAIKVMMETKGAKKILICVPASLRPNWSAEVRKFLDMDLYELLGSSPTNNDLFKLISGHGWRIALANYDQLGAKVETKKVWKDEKGIDHSQNITRFPWVEAINLASFDFIIIDEGHRIKNVESNRSQAVRQLTCGHKLVLSGTPLVNRPDELWPLLKFLDPQLAGDHDTFIRRYTVDKKIPRNVDELREILRPLMIRREKKDVMKDLKPINRIERIIPLSPDGKKKYQLVEEGLFAALDEWDGDPSNTQLITNILTQILRMKQVCSWDSIEYTVDLAIEMYDSNTTDWRKGIIFTQFTNSPPVLTELHKRFGHESLIVSGQDNPRERQEIINEFHRRDDIHFLVASTLAISEGLNITAAGFVIFNDLMWTPKDHHQAEGRAYGRMSDAHTIDSVYMANEGTIGIVIMELLAKKLEIFNQIINGTELSRDVTIQGELLSKIKEMRYKLK